eukprot:jgi/Psemu1/23416/gm1.23416_g
MSSSSDISSALDSYTLEELQKMLTAPQLGTQLANKIEAEVFARLATKSQNGSPIGILVTPSKQQKMSEQIGEAEKALSKYTTLVEQLMEETMRVKEDIIKPLQETISSAKKRPPSAKTSLQFSPTPKQKKEEINVESDEESKESEEDLNRKPVSKPKSKKHNNFSKDDITGYIRNKSQNFTKHRFHNLEPGVAVMKLSNNSWIYDANFPDTLMSSKHSFQKIPNAVMCIHTLYRSMVRVPDAEVANKEEQPVEMITKIVITKIAETHADVVMADTGLEYFMTKFPNMKKLDIDLCGLITSQPGEGTFKHNPNNNAIAVFLLKGQVKRYHYVLVNAIQSLVLFMYHWDGKYFGRNVLDAALNRNYDEVIRLMEPYIVLHEKRSGKQQPLLAFVGAWQIGTDEE